MGCLDPEPIGSFPCNGCRVGNFGSIVFVRFKESPSLLTRYGVSTVTSTLASCWASAPHRLQPCSLPSQKQAAGIFVLDLSSLIHTVWTSGLAWHWDCPQPQLNKADSESPTRGTLLCFLLNFVLATSNSRTDAAANMYHSTEYVHRSAWLLSGVFKKQG